MDEATEPGAVRVRPAVESDAAALAEVELATPIVAGEDRITYDRREDYFAYARLMDTHHLRILPGSQGKKVFPMLKQVAMPRYPPEARACTCSSTPGTDPSSTGCT